MDLFVSYAWSPIHQEWVHLLASHLHLLGYDVVVDKDVDYGSDLNGFMRKVQEARHVLLIVDQNYAIRADTLPDSGVAKENEWIKQVYNDRPDGWLTALLVRNPEGRIPSWLKVHEPLVFDFRGSRDRGFPGSEQLEDLWRWIEGLPRDKANSVPLKIQRERNARLESIDNLRDPGSWRSPAPKGKVHFPYTDTTDYTYTVGAGEYEFGIRVSGSNFNSVQVLSDPVHSIGLVQAEVTDWTDLARFIRPGRVVRPKVGQTVVLMNHHGVLCTVHITDVQDEVNDTYGYTAPYVDFAYEIRYGS